ncbi:MAG: hypothetical protein HQL06_10925 [Nitrospirae bacterium]|nr:hypothetical protein [Nitrospirota bacterium]
MARAIDVFFHKGKMAYPLFVFMHGLGMDKNVWVYPEKARVLAGSYPIEIMLSRAPQQKVVSRQESISPITTGELSYELDTVFHDLMALDMPCLAFSLQRPANEVVYALNELTGILNAYKDYTRQGVIIVGHSRGAVVARRFAETLPPTVDVPLLGIISISAPHGGSTLAKWATVLSTFTSLVLPYLEDVEKGTFLSKIQRSFNFLSSRAVKELLPNSELIRSLVAKPARKFFTLSIGTIKAELFTLYSVQFNSRPGDDKRMLTYKKLFSVPEILTTILPNGIAPDEITDGLGDGLVSEKSSRIPYSDKHIVYPLNHVEVLFDEQVRTDIISELKQQGFV